MTEETKTQENQINQEQNIPKDHDETGKVTWRGLLLKMNKYVGLGCAISISWYSYVLFSTNQKRYHLKKQLVYSPSIIQQSNRKLNEYLNVMTGQIKDFLFLSNNNQNDTQVQDGQKIYGKIKYTYEVLEGQMFKTMKLIDESIQKYYQVGQEGEYEHIPITFVKENDKTTVCIKNILVMGKLGTAEKDHPYLSSNDKQADFLLYKRNFQEKMYLNTMLQKRQNPVYNLNEEWVNSFELNDSQKDMKVIVKNFSKDSVITKDCLDHLHTEKNIIKLEKEIGILFACSLLLSPFPFYNGIQIGIQDNEIGIKAKGIFCLLGDLIFDVSTQSFRMDNPQFIARSKSAIIDYLSQNIEIYQNKLKNSVIALSTSFLIYYVLTHQKQINSKFLNLKQKVKNTLHYLYTHIL